MKNFQNIIDALPYSKPFLFVDSLSRLDEEGVEGYYHFRDDEYFYQGHFKERPLTPGVILTECMAQIGLVCLGIYLLQALRQRPAAIHQPGIEDKAETEGVQFVFSEAQVLYEKPVFPGERVRVLSRKKYWRLGKLSCAVEMFNEAGDRVCQGTLSGMIR